ncbi:MAG: UDP-galactopyranose mutase [Tannerellaceae bacterium]|jgi:UDP-galactopyranose mutase|nr:UDP-galactopyranose mutase [Tannerellaceae bacterium]
MYDYLIVGAGLFGSVFAQILNSKGKHCLVVDKRTHIGGNIFTEEKEGIQIHQYGAHIFHTDKEDVWEYINRFARFNHFINSPLACYKGELYNLPFNMNTFYRLWQVKTPEEAKKKLEEQCRPYKHITEPANLEEQALKLCGTDIYHTFIKGYTEKQWGKAAVELPAFIIKRIPFRFVFDNNYFDDPYQGIPVGGYTRLIGNLLEGIEVRVNTDYFKNRSCFERIAHKTLFTGCLDEYFDYCLGRLEYRSLHFEHQCLETDNYQGNAVVNYNEASVPFTRIIEHKHFEFGEQPGTVITREYPQPFTPSSEPYYPVNDGKNNKLLGEYRALAKQYPDILFGGRLGQYAYMDMDDTISAAFTLAQNELHKQQ